MQSRSEIINEIRNTLEAAKIFANEIYFYDVDLPIVVIKLYSGWGGNYTKIIDILEKAGYLHIKENIYRNEVGVVHLHYFMLPKNKIIKTKEYAI